MERVEFSERCQDAARAFVRTVAVVDDYAEWMPRDSPPSDVDLPAGELRPEVGAPTAASMAQQERGGPSDLPTSEDSSTAGSSTQRPPLSEADSGPGARNELAIGASAIAPRREDQSHALQTGTLAAAFADLGIVCSVLISPTLGDDALRASWTVRIHRLASHVDVLVTDWSWNGDSGGFCLGMLGQLLRGGAERRQLVVIYTASDDPTIISHGLTELGGIAEPVGLTFRWTSGLDVVVLQKPGARTAFHEGSQVSEAELPERIIKEFGRLSGGLVTNAVMHAFGAVRDRTHRVLAEFDPSLDAAYVVHRAYTRPRQGAEDQVAGLLSDALADLVHETTVSTHLGDEQVAEWLNSDRVSGAPHEIKEALGGGPKTSIADGTLKPKAKPVNLATITARLVGKTPDDGRELHLRFGRLIYASNVRADRAPKLGIGVLVQAAEQYYLCVLPLCDAERVPRTGAAFPFLRVERGIAEGARHFVLRESSGDHATVELRVSAKMSTLYLATFVPAGDQQPVRARAGNGGWVFNDNAKIEYRYVARLRPIVAQEIVARLAGSGSRVGLMESEYTRLAE